MTIEKYRRMSAEEVLAKVEEYQHESLFRAYCHAMLYNGRGLSVAELWCEAKQLVKLLYGKEHPEVWINTVYQLYSRRYEELFAEWPVEERLKCSESVRDEVFWYATLMYLHVMASDEEMKAKLTFAAPVKEFVVSIPSETGLDDEYIFWEYNNYYTYLAFLSLKDFISNPTSGYQFEEKYEEKVKNQGITYDYNYIEGKWTDASVECVPIVSGFGFATDIPDEWTEEEAVEWLDMAVEEHLLERVGKLYKWLGSATLYGVFVDATSDVLDLKLGKTRLDWQLFAKIIINGSQLTRAAMVSNSKWKNDEKELDNIIGYDKILRIQKELG